MHNDSIETLLLRHYGEQAPAPPALEQRLLASLRREELEMRRQQEAITRLRTRKVSRRRVVGLVALGSAGLSLLSISLESLNSLERSFMGQDTSRPALSY
ncbi:MAG: hypothetical protein IMW89_21090 [Ktedonobacteraceae bacterium]|nr:hypothetical protein [Ktedonobacteraceae bacterium]